MAQTLSYFQGIGKLGGLLIASKNCWEDLDMLLQINTKTALHLNQSEFSYLTL